ncbi:MAG: hypothetical protein ACRDRD_18395 [Pseudonocardiaceae bacterium]
MVTAVAQTIEAMTISLAWVVVEVAPLSGAVELAVAVLVRSSVQITVPVAVTS